MTRVLVVDDLPVLAEQYAYDLERVGGYDTLVATGGREALEVLRSQDVGCVVLDLEMPGVDGFQVLRTLQAEGIATPVIVYTGTGSYDRCVQALRLGAHGFIDKEEPVERVVREIENALERDQLATEVEALRRQLHGETSLLGESPAMVELKETLARVAAIPSPVLIVGESGCGKELVARELHRLGARSGSRSADAAPFVAVNSAALPENLVESELFGHERGAFTGAHRLHRGAFETAHRGTLFLDEIGELPLPAQAKLLRVLEEGQVTRVGASRPVRVDTRVVAATHRDLEHEVEAGRFRRDLYYRLNVHILQVPPLRRRLSDVPVLVEHFLTTTCRRFGMRKKEVDAGAMEALTSYDWAKNNVRELRNIVERMIIASDRPTIEARDVPPEICRREGSTEGTLPHAGTLKDRKAEAERQILLAALRRNDWHITRTARELGLADHSSLLKIMRRHHLKRG